MTVPRILIADDQEKLRSLMTAALRRRGFDGPIDTAADGKIALGLLSQRPDIVILDINMPGLTGLELLPHVRAQCPDAAVIVITGIPDSALRDEALRGGADAFYPKTFSASAIAEAALGLWKDKHPGQAAEAEDLALAAARKAAAPALLGDTPVADLQAWDTPPS